MTELTPQEQKVFTAIKSLGATSADKLKNADQITNTAGLAKGIVGNALTTLCSKNVIKRVAREKAAGYYALE